MRKRAKSSGLLNENRRKNAQNSLFYIEKLSVLRCKVDYFTLQGWLFYDIRLTILGCKVDCLGLQDTRNGCEGGLKRCWEMLISTFSVVKIFHTTVCFLQVSKEEHQGVWRHHRRRTAVAEIPEIKRRPSWHITGDGHDDLFLLCRYCETGCALTFMTPCWASLW